MYRYLLLSSDNVLGRMRKVQRVWPRSSIKTSVSLTLEIAEATCTGTVTEARKTQALTSLATKWSAPGRTGRVRVLKKEPAAVMGRPSARITHGEIGFRSSP